MSCYEWERGVIKLNTKEYSRVKKAFIDAIRMDQEKKLQRAVELYNCILAKVKGKRGVDIHSAYYSVRSENDDLDEESVFYETCLNHNNRCKRPLKPKKKDFIFKVERKNPSVDLMEASISFNDSNRTIGWNVEENNHSKERAHNKPLAKALFKLLADVKWTRGTGGTIVGNDEYNQDNSDYGGGGNYVTMRFGPVGM